MSISSKELREIIRRIENAAFVVAGDLSLLISLYIARFIVWRTLRSRRRENNDELREDFASSNDEGRAGFEGASKV